MGHLVNEQAKWRKAMTKFYPDDIEKYTRKEIVEISLEQLRCFIELQKKNEQLESALSLAGLVAKDKRIAELEKKEGRFDQYTLESEVMRKVLLGKDRSSDDVSPQDLKDALKQRDLENTRKGFWFGFEDARCHPDEMNILAQWESTLLFKQASELDKAK
jgi:hypothetical protein